jgi:hypothetical protein
VAGLQGFGESVLSLVPAGFAAWDGFGGLRHEIALGARFAVPGREYHLLGGPLEALSESAVEPGYQLANLWWRADRAWCVATEIDLDTTYIACDRSAETNCCARPRSRPWRSNRPAESTSQATF